MDSNKSVNKYQTLKDSFSDRVCDDLCEEILQWLPIKDKLVLNLVSKQFKQCLKKVCLRHKVLDFHYPLFDFESHSCNHNNNITEILINESVFLFEYKLNARKFSTILELMPNITEINVLIVTDEEFKDLFVLITKFCNKLRKICFTFDDIDQQLVVEFAEKMGPNLRTLEIKSSKYSEPNPGIRYLLKRSTCLASLEMFKNTKLLFDNENKRPTVLVNNLKELIVGKTGLKCLSEIVDKNPNLVRFKLHLKTESSFETCIAFRKLSKLKELRFLDIGFTDNDTFDNRIVESLATIANNCKKLKHFRFFLLIHYSFETKQLLNVCKQFSRLQSFALSLNEELNNQNTDIDITMFENSKQLTYLSVHSENIIISEQFFRQIGSILPNLVELSVSTYFRDKLNDNYLELLSQLKNLKSLSIGWSESIPNDNQKPFNSLITDSGIISLIIGCNDLNYFHLYFNISITEVSIKAIIGKAIEKPGIHFMYRLYDINNIEHKIPKMKNLAIVFEKETDLSITDSEYDSDDLHILFSDDESTDDDLVPYI